MLNHMQLNRVYRDFLLSFFTLLCIFSEVHSATVRQFTGDNGLGNDHVKGLAFDRYGYLWIGTENGLKRFDGSEFKTYNLQEIFKIKSPENRVVNVFPLRDGSILGIFVNGITCKAVGDSVVKCQFPVSVFGPLTHCREADNFEILNGIYYVRKAGPSYLIQDIPYKGLTKIDFKTCKADKKFSTPDEPTANAFNRVFNYGSSEVHYIDKNLRTWKLINGQWEYPSKIQGLKSYPDLKPEDILVKNDLFDSTTFLLIKDDIYFLTPGDSTRTWNARLINVHINPKDLYSISYSYQFKTLAIGTISNGLYIIYNALSEDRTKIYRTSSERGLFFIDSNKLLTSTLKLIENDKMSEFRYNEPGTQTSYFLKDRLNRNFIYVNHDAPFFLRSKIGKPTDFETFPLKKHDNPKFAIEDNFGRVWMFFPNSGVYVYSNPADGPPRLITKFDSLRLVRYVINKDDYLYAYTDLSRIYKFNARQLNYQIQDFKGLPVNIRSMHELGKDSFLVATYGNGLKMVFNNTVIDLPKDRFNALIYSHCINDIGNNRLLISTNNGLILMFKDDIYNYLRRKIPINYRIIHNFPGFKNEFNGECFPCSQMKGNLIYYPHIEGIAKIDLNSFHLDDNSILNFKLDSIAFGLGSMQGVSQSSLIVQMPTTANILHLKTSVIYWGDRSNLSIRAIVQNGNYSTDTVFQNNKPVFENLPTGENIIQLELYNAGKLVKTISILVVVPQKYYQRPAFWVFLISIFLAITLSGIFLYNNILIKRNNELQHRVQEATAELEVLLEKISEDKLAIEQSIQFKNRIISVISHDVLGPINFTNIVLTSISKNLSEYDKMQISEIKKSNERIVDQAYEILTWSKAQNLALYGDIKIFDVHELVSEIYERHSPLAHKKNITFTNYIDPGTEIRSDRSIVTIILNNLIENAFKYGENQVNIQMHESEHFQEYIVCNAGKKFNPLYVRAFNIRELDKAVKYTNNPVTGGYGLRICQEILQALGGGITIDDQHDDLTCVYVKIPLEFKEMPDITDDSEVTDFTD